jgi:hypothetical protein
MSQMCVGRYRINPRTGHWPRLFTANDWKSGHIAVCFPNQPAFHEMPVFFLSNARGTEMYGGDLHIGTYDSGSGGGCSRHFDGIIYHEEVLARLQLQYASEIRI